MEYGQRLKHARELMGLSQDELSTTSGVKQGTISKIERGDQNRSSFDYELSKALRISQSWLSRGTGEMILKPYSQEAIGRHEIKETQPKTNSFIKIPLINWLDICELISSNYQFREDETVFTKPPISTRAFALSMQDDRYKTIADKGDYIIFDPETPPSMEKRIVLVSFDSGSTFEIWKYTILAGKEHIEPISHSSNPIQINNSNIKIHATGIKAVSERNI